MQKKTIKSIVCVYNFPRWPIDTLLANLNRLRAPPDRTALSYSGKITHSADGGSLSIMFTCWDHGLLKVTICHDARTGRQTYPFFVKDQHWSWSYSIICGQRPRCLICHPEIFMKNLFYFRNYRLFSVKNIILNFNKKISTEKRLFLNFTPLHLWEKQFARAFSQLW